jgi:hypothetical protein
LALSGSADHPYAIKDGDIPCTPEEEPAFNYAWNFCETLPTPLVPEMCANQGKFGVVLQYLQVGEKKSCFIIGHFDPAHQELTYNLLDVADPSKGISVSYPPGETCSMSNPVARSATVDVTCANVKYSIVSAQEPTPCQYHLVMKSYYGCPTVGLFLELPLT